MELLNEINKEGNTSVIQNHTQQSAGVAGRIINLLDEQVTTDAKA